jgi:hypothetical protein
MDDKINEYISIHKEVSELKKKQSKLKKSLKELEEGLKEYMQKNNMNSLLTSSGNEIILYDKKIPQTFKKENIINKLTEKLQETHLNNTSVSDLAESIFKNDVFVVEGKIKLNAKK